MPNRSNRMVIGLALLGMGALMLGVLNKGQSARPTNGTPVHQAGLPIAITHLTWHNKPIFRVTNTTGVPLHHFWITSWSEFSVPYLYIGSSTPANLTTLQPLSNPPYTFSPGQTLWFVGPTLPPAKFTVIWDANGVTQQAILSVDSNT